MVWDGGAQAEVTTLQVIVLSRIEWLLVSVREAFFFFFNSPSLLSLRNWIFTSDSTQK